MNNQEACESSADTTPESRLAFGGLRWTNSVLKLGLIYAVPALVAAVILLVSTRLWGLGVNTDSIAYLDAAHNLAEGNGLVLSFVLPKQVPLTHGQIPFPLFAWPPGYSALLAVFDFFGDAFSAARWLNAFLLVTTAVMIGLIARKVTNSAVAGFFVATFFGISPGVFEQYAWVVSEPFFVAASYAGLWLLSAHLDSGRFHLLILASGALAVTLLVRYTAPPLIATAALAILLLGRGSVGSRLVRSGVLMIIALLPFGLWMVRTRQLTGITTGRSLIWHPFSLNSFARRIVDNTGWVFPDVSGIWQIAAFIPFALVLAAFAIEGVRQARTRKIPPFIVIVLLYSAATIGFLILAICLTDPLGGLEMRYMLAIYPGVLVAFAWILSGLPAGHRIRRITPACLALAVGFSLCGVAQHAQKLNALGFGFSERSWRQSDGIAWVRTLPSGTTLYSDLPDAIYFLTGRVAKTIPVKQNFWTDSPYSKYDDHFNAMLADFERGAVIAFIHPNQDRSVLTTWPRSYLADEATVAARLGDADVRRLKDTTIYRRK